VPAASSAFVFDTFAHGKLLLTGEYAVLDGALALAVPVRYGQRLHVESWKQPGRLSWTSRSHTGETWFLAEFELPGLEIFTASDLKTAQGLQAMLRACHRRNAAFLDGTQGYKVLTQNDFPREWGLGTSSTLVAALARWAAVDPYAVLFETLGGSGYDVACAYATEPIVYRLQEGQPYSAAAAFAPPFTAGLYFVYLNQKQDSRAAIQRYRATGRQEPGLIDEVTALTEACVQAGTLREFETALERHENRLSQVLGLPRVQQLFFDDYWGAVKSLGAWGGDFALATSDRPEAETRQYFNEKGFAVFMPYASMVL
jgi:mevalonate kinase